MATPHPDLRRTASDSVGSSLNVDFDSFNRIAPFIRGAEWFNYADDEKEDYMRRFLEIHDTFGTRIAADGIRYSFPEFMLFYKDQGLYMWCLAHSTPHVDITETRVALDGVRYTYEEFEQYYQAAALHMWSQSMPVPESSNDAQEGYGCLSHTTPHENTVAPDDDRLSIGPSHHSGNICNIDMTESNDQHSADHQYTDVVILQSFPNADAARTQWMRELSEEVRNFVPRSCPDAPIDSMRVCHRVHEQSSSS